MSNDCNESFKKCMKRRAAQYARMSDDQRAAHDKEQQRQRNALADRLCYIVGERSKDSKYESGL